jgi:hypothetical protein
MITRDLVVREIAITKKRLVALQSMLATFPALVAPGPKPKPQAVPVKPKPQAQTAAVTQ